MKPPPVLSEGVMQTERLSLYQLQCRSGIASNEPVLFLGGSNFDLRLKRNFLNAGLLSWCDICTFEPRGIGRSGQPDGLWEMQDYAKDAFAYLDALGLETVSIIGESFGGMTALHMALLAPQRIRRLALASATPGGEGGSSYDIARFLDLPLTQAAEHTLLIQDSRHRDMKTNQPELFRTLLKQRLAFETAFREQADRKSGFRRLLAARAAHNVWDRLAEITCEVIIIAGRTDRQAPAAFQRAMAHRLPNGIYREFEGGHGVLFSEAVPLRRLKSLWAPSREAAVI